MRIRSGTAAKRLIWGALAALGLALPVAAQPAPPPFGMSYSYLNVDPKKVAECRTRSRGATMKAGAFLPRYDQPGVRERVRKDLADMRRSGFQEIRTLVWFGRIREGDGDWFDVADPGRAARLIRQYQNDVAAAGFTGSLLGFSPQGTSSPICRRGEWGECFDPLSITASGDFVLAVRDALGATPPVPLRLDLGPEYCPPDKPLLVHKTLQTYVAAIVGRYTRAYPNDRTSISCSIRRFVVTGAQAETDRLYAGKGPSFYLIHAYARTDFDTPKEIRRVLAERPNKDIPFVIGENSYDNREHLQQLLQAFSDAQVPLQAVFFWPLHDAMTTCHMDTAPPYTLRDASGGLFGAAP
ncbi:hypothetical protein [Reyranella sp.]|uniref:hypothetical protein n=1 Tax=Reyranella sp. TaxID=1929291 RepID=UPI003BA9678A